MPEDIFDLLINPISYADEAAAAAVGGAAIGEVSEHLKQRFTDPKSKPLGMEPETLEALKRTAGMMAPTGREYLGQIAPMVAGPLGLGASVLEQGRQLLGKIPAQESGSTAPVPEEFSDQYPPLEAEAPARTASERSNLVNRIRALGRPLPSFPGMQEELEESKTLETWAQMNQADVARQAAEATATTMGKAQTEIESRQLEIDKVKQRMVQHQDEIRTSIDERVTRAMYPGIPDGVEDGNAWIQDMKKAAADSTLPQDQREAALSQLNDAQPKTGMQEVFGSWWRVLLGAVSMALGTVGSAMSGGPNHAANIIFKGIDMRVKEKMLKEKRLSRIGALRTAEAQAGLDITKSEYSMMLQQQMFELKMAGFGVQKIVAEAEMKGKEHAAQGLIAAIDGKYQRAEMQLALQRSTQERSFEAQSLGLEVQAQRQADEGRKISEASAKELRTMQTAMNRVKEMQAKYEDLPPQVVSLVKGWWPFISTDEKEYEAAREAAGRFIYRQILKDRMSNVDAQWATEKLMGGAYEPRGVGMSRFDATMELIEDLYSGRLTGLQDAGFIVNRAGQLEGIDRARFDQYLESRGITARE